MLPALFIGHGSPMNALGHNKFSSYLGELNRNLPRPQSILVISAHWETKGTEVLESEDPPTIHDFFGFPQELYRIRYPAPGAPDLARRVSELMGKSVMRTRSWGLDHGAWAVLHHLYPAANIPVTQLSLDRTLTLRDHYNLASSLKPLRREGVLILGSGNIVHNLRNFSWAETEAPYPWAERFDAWIAEALRAHDLEKLLEFKGIEPELAKMAVPSPEHYLPLIYALAVSDGDDKISFPFTEIQNGSIAMRSVRFG